MIIRTKLDIIRLKIANYFGKKAIEEFNKREDDKDLQKALRYVDLFIWIAPKHEITKGVDRTTEIIKEIRIKMRNIDL